MSKLSLPLPEELKVGQLYRIHSRNLKYGVWNGDTFIGIRTKWGDRFLDEEDHWVEPGGTVRGAVELPERVPIELELASHLGAVCGRCHGPVAWRGLESGWLHLGGEADHTVLPQTQHNLALFDWLVRQELQYE